MTSYKGNSITWTSYNLPSSIAAAGQSSQFWYGPNRNRWKQLASYPRGTETTIYVGGVLEKVTVSTGTAWRHYVGAGSAKVVYTRWSTGSENTKYLTADHLNSSSVLMDSSGNTLVGMSFAAYGRRRGSAWTGAPSSGDWTQINNGTRHGYTGHEHLDNVNLIHMNGRVFEPVLGRFLSADPFIDGISHSQGPNRFAYVRGNPLRFTDPTGWTTDDEKTVTQWINKNEVAMLEQIDVFGGRFELNAARDAAFQQAVWIAGFRQFAIAEDGSPEFTDVNEHDVVVTARRITRRAPRSTGVGGSSAGASPGSGESRENRLPCSAATAGPDGDGILIQLAYTNVIGNLNHAFVVAIDPSSGQVYASRGGPGSGPGGGAGISFNDFVARSGSLNANFPDRLAEVHSVQTVGRINASFASVVSYMNSFADVTNSNSFNYWLLIQNSNSYAFTMTEGMGFARPDPAIPAPGYWTNRVDPRLTCRKP